MGIVEEKEKTELFESLPSSLASVMIRAMIEVGIREYGCDKYLDMVIEKNHQFLAKDEDSHCAFAICKVLIDAKEIFIKNGIEENSKIKWNAHFNNVRAEYENRLIRELIEEINKKVKEQTDDLAKKLRFDICDEGE